MCLLSRPSSGRSMESESDCQFSESQHLRAMFYSDLHAILEDSGTHGPGYARFRGRVGCVPRPGKASTVPVISRPAGTCSFPSLPSKPGNRFRGITKHKYEACNLDFYSLQGLGGACVGDRGRREAPVRELSVLGLGVRLLPRSVLSLGLPPVPLRTLTHTQEDAALRSSLLGAEEAGVLRGMCLSWWGACVRWNATVFLYRMLCMCVQE